MTHVVCEPCHDCKYTDCVAVCPCESFYDDGQRLVIDPSSCIDCEACKMECPVGSIFQDVDVPARWSAYIEQNAERAAVLRAGGPLTEKQTPLEGPGCRAT